MSSPLVSIITPVYNGEQYLSEAIESALAQTYQNFELLIINDGSTDNSAEIIKPFLKDSRVIYIEQKNAGVAAARNTAIKQARGKYIGFLDQDDCWLPDKLSTQIQFLEKKPELAFVHSRQDYIQADGVVITDYPKDWVTDLHGNCFVELFKRNRISVLTVLLRKKVIDEIGFFNEAVSRVDDYELWLRICSKYPIDFQDEKLALYRCHDTNASHEYVKMEQAELNALGNFYKKNKEAFMLMDKNILNHRFFVLHTDVANNFFWQEHNYSFALHHYLKALYFKPFCWKNIKQAFWCLLSNTQRKKLLWYLSKIQQAIYRL
ncbi:MAG: glycosyltransferase [Methylococcales bacterium]|nr:MAG: glycosyltransferase [Methylococcales bacterium]